jgi:tRNA (cmo5U34)-methyltransferase
VSQFHFDPATYRDMIEAEVPGYGTLHDELVRAGDDRRVGAILDLGTGTGETALRVLERHPGARLVGVDESPGMLAVAAERLPGVELVVQRLQDPLPPGPFDLVVSALAVHHLTGPEKADLFARVRAALAGGGRFVLGDVVVPEEGPAVTPVSPDYDRPDRVADQLAWLADAGLDPALVWAEDDLAVMVGDLRG